MKRAALIFALTSMLGESYALALVDNAPVLEEIPPPAPLRGAVVAYVGEALPWSAYGILWERPYDENSPYFMAVGAGRFKQAAFPHAQETLDILAQARSIAAGGQWSMLYSVFSLRAGLCLTSFSGSFTQRGIDVAGQATAAELLGSGFSGPVITSFFSGVFAYDFGRIRLEIVPVGFRFALWHSVKQDRETPHQIGLSRYLAGNSVFGLVNLGAGVTF